MSLSVRYTTQSGKTFERFLAFVDCHDNIYNDNNKFMEKDDTDDSNSEDCNDDDDDDMDNNDDENHRESGIVEPKLTGELLGKIVIKIMTKVGLNLDNCIGISTDGCSVMVSTLKGAVQYIQKFTKHGVYCPCNNHALNLSISKSSTVQDIRNSVGIMQQVISFF